MIQIDGVQADVEDLRQVVLRQMEKTHQPNEAVVAATLGLSLLEVLVVSMATIANKLEKQDLE